MEDLKERIKDRLNEKDSPIKSLKGLAEAIGMSEGGLHEMLNRGTMKLKTRNLICEALGIDGSYFDEYNKEKPLLVSKIEDGSFNEIIHELKEMKSDLIEQLRVKDKQLEAKDNQINMLLSLLGKIEGVIGRPLFSEVELLKMGVALP